MNKPFLIPDEVIVSKIFLIRKQKVMLDKDLAEMYGVETRRLNEQVRRNLTRFPHDFMFQLSEVEYENLMSQNATSSWGGNRKLPFVFTEHGILMLSNVLKSDIAIEMSIKIIRIFTKLREMLLTHKDILLKLEILEKQIVQNSEETQIIFNVLKELINTPPEPRNPIGFKI
jgi:hypothetical protein